ncbi:hypothetical protein G7054_g6726 [Neopestalotiopsis clavispora]|nr:hypothetical protein G7054_g6726 [Neopestalotiopsis clavispora]
MAPPSPESHLLPVDDQPVSDTTISTEDSQQLQEETHSPETISHDPNLEILKLLREIRDEQKNYFTLRQERWNPALQLPQIAQRLWESRDDAWAGAPSRQRAWVGAEPQETDLYKDRGIGRAFLHRRISYCATRQQRTLQMRTLQQQAMGCFVLEFRSMTLMHFMRSFVATDSFGPTQTKVPMIPGMRCYRDHVTFRGLYDDKDSEPKKLLERRYSIGLAMLPLQRPAGHFCLVSIHDHIGTLWDGYLDWGEYEARWKRFGLRPAGLYSGICVFQLEICVCIVRWEGDWTITIRELEEKISLKLDILEDNQRLRKLVLDNTADASVLYFKLLQLLNFFSDTVRDAPRDLEWLAQTWFDSPRNYWFQESYPHMKETLQIIDSNWDIVREHQKEASSRILEKLQRMTNEVKSLQNGLFNVQSITEAQRSFLEAQKSRTLNKYLMVFTIVTIIFLPPTFVATFFGMDVFQSDTEGDTKRSFWTVLGALSGVTYLLAALGLFGSNLSAEERKAWKETTTLWREGAKLRWNGLWSSRHRSGESKTPQTEV